MTLSPYQSGFVTVDGVRLHYLDWGGSGPALLFIPGMGCTAYIFSEFAPRFTDQFRVLALTRRGHGDSDYPASGYDPDTLAGDVRGFLDALDIDQVILAGHSMGYIEVSRFACLYPDRVLKLVYLDAAYDRQSEGLKAMFRQNPLPKIIPPWPEAPFTRLEDYIARVRWTYRGLDAVWGPVFDEEVRHNVRITPEGVIEDKTPEAVNQALVETMNTYDADYAAIQAPMLCIFALQDGTFFLSEAYMDAGQQAQVLDYFASLRGPYEREYIAQFRRRVPQATVVEIPGGHHYCFLHQPGLIEETMRQFLAE